MVSRTPPFKWPKHAKNDAFSTTKTTFSAWASVSGILVAASLIGIKCIHILGPHFSNDKCHTYTYIGSMIQGSCPPPFKLPKHIHAVSRTRFFTTKQNQSNTTTRNQPIASVQNLEKQIRRTKNISEYKIVAAKAKIISRRAGESASPKSFFKGFTR